ncbi:hypothetical protein ACLPIF_17805, partial [Providencia sp. Me1]
FTLLILNKNKKDSIQLYYFSSKIYTLAPKKWKVIIEKFIGSVSRHKNNSIVNSHLNKAAIIRFSDLKLADVMMKKLKYSRDIGFHARKFILQ